MMSSSIKLFFIHDICFTFIIFFQFFLVVVTMQLNRFLSVLDYMLLEVFLGVDALLTVKVQLQVNYFSLFCDFWMLVV